MMTEDSSGGFDGRRPPALTDDQGRFRFDNLRSGSYALTAEGLRGGARGFARADTGDDVRIELKELTTLSGTVTLEGEPVPRFRVTLEGPSRLQRGVRAADGTFSLRRIDPGTYTRIGRIR